MSERKELCETCRWWNDWREDLQPFGDCRRFPPQLFHLQRMPAVETPESDLMDSTVWPLTECTDFCGEWTPADQPAVNPNFLKQPCRVLNLSVRARKCLVRLGVLTVSDLIRKHDCDILECRNAGITTLDEIKARLAEHGLRLGIG